MRATTNTLALLAAAGLAQLTAAAINITTSNDTDLAAGTGNLGWGASGLSFGYSGGCGLNFDAAAQTLGAGFNGGIPDQPDGAVGGGYTINATSVVIGLGGMLGNKSIGVEILQDRVTGVVSITVNGKAVAL